MACGMPSPYPKPGETTLICPDPRRDGERRSTAHVYIRGLPGPQTTGQIIQPSSQQRSSRPSSFQDHLQDHCQPPSTPQTCSSPRSPLWPLWSWQSQLLLLPTTEHLRLPRRKWQLLQRIPLLPPLLPARSSTNARTSASPSWTAPNFSTLPR